MNSQNLIPNSERSPDELREMGRRGGIASGKARRKKAELKKTKGENMQTSETEKTSAATMGDTNFNQNNFNTSYTRSTPSKVNPAEGRTVRKEIWTITPEMAQELLDTNQKNRRLRPTKVEQYARDMSAGNWKIDGNEISLSPSGKLLDGQHRMMALIKSGSTIDFWMALGVPETTKFDIGATRSSADTLRIARLLNNPYLATDRVASLTNSFFRAVYGPSTASKMTDNDRANFINSNEDDIYFVMSIVGCNGAYMNRGPITASLIAALKCGVDRDELETFSKEVNSGIIYNDSHSAASVLRSMLMEIKYSGGGGHMQDVYLSITCQAIADHAKRKPRRKKYSNNKIPYFEELKRREGIA